MTQPDGNAVQVFEAKIHAENVKTLFFACALASHSFTSKLGSIRGAIASRPALSNVQAHLGTLGSHSSLLNVGHPQFSPTPQSMLSKSYPPQKHLYIDRSPLLFTPRKHAAEQSNCRTPLTCAHLKRYPQQIANLRISLPAIPRSISSVSALLEDRIATQLAQSPRGLALCTLELVI